MRRLLLASLSVAVSACSWNPASPDGPVINVLVTDDIGAPVKRTAIRVTASEARIEGRTGNDGTTGIRVGNAGSYTVHVIPREGYVAGTEPLSKTVTVDANETAAVTFTVHRRGVSTADPRPTEW